MNPIKQYLPPKPATPPLAQSTISVENPKLLNMKTNKEEEEGTTTTTNTNTKEITNPNARRKQ